MPRAPYAGAARRPSGISRRSGWNFPDARVAAGGDHARVGTTLATAVAPGQIDGQQSRRERLAERAARLEDVIAALRERVRAREVAGVVPPPLLAAIDGFEQELRRVRRELDS
jgi:hypothetical protein